MIKYNVFFKVYYFKERTTKGGGGDLLYMLKKKDGKYNDVDKRGKHNRLGT